MVKAMIFAGDYRTTKVSGRINRVPLTLYLQRKHSNENTGVKPSFVSSRRILRLVIGDKAKRLCVVSELRSRRRVSVPHRVCADSRRRKHISTSHDQPRQSLFESLVET